MRFKNTDIALGFRVQFNAELPRQVTNFPIVFFSKFVLAFSGLKYFGEVVN